MVHRLTNDVKVLSIGARWPAGRVVSPGEISPALWRRWIDDGVLVEDEGQHGNQGSQAPSENDSATAPDEIERLRARAKEAGVEYYWAKNAETLREELADG